MITNKVKYTLYVQLQYAVHNQLYLMILMANLVRGVHTVKHLILITLEMHIMVLSLS